MSRWAYPIKMSRIKYEELSSLLITYITTGGDIVELFSYVEESIKVKNLPFFLFIIGLPINFDFFILTTGYLNCVFFLLKFRFP